MKNDYKATFTLPPELIEVLDYVKTNWGLGKSKTVQVCIENTFKLMEEELNDPEEFIFPKKFKGTVPITVNLPYTVFETLDYYASKLDIAKSHLVDASIKYTLMTIDESQKDLDQEIDELMEEVESLPEE